MKLHEFFGKYANLPLSERTKTITHNRYGGNIEPITLDKLYRDLKAVEDTMRPYRIERDKLLEIASGYFEPIER